MTDTNFNDADIATILDNLVSYALASGRFDSVNTHEPKNSPGTGVTCSIWVQMVTPIRMSGLASVSGLLVFSVRVYTSFTQQPFDGVDPQMLAAIADFMGALCGDFEFSDTVDIRMVDLLGSQGTPMRAQAGYVEIDRQVFRVMTLTVPIVVNDMFTESA